MGRLDGKVGDRHRRRVGFGRATALRFAEEGARVVVVDLDEPRGAAVVDEVQALGVRRRASWSATSRRSRWRRKRSPPRSTSSGGSTCS